MVNNDTTGTQGAQPISKYLPHALEDLIRRALEHGAAFPQQGPGGRIEFSGVERTQMSDYAHALSNDTWLMETCDEPPKKVLWRAGWLIPGAKPEMGYQVLGSWSEAIEYLLDTMTSISPDRGAGSDVHAAGVRRRTTYTTISENEEGWVRFFNRVWFIEKLDDPNN